MLDNWTSAYFDPDEALVERFGRGRCHSLSLLCHGARKAARELPLAGHPGRAGALARHHGVTVRYDDWDVADIRVTYLAECTAFPPAISLNRAGLRRLTSALSRVGSENIEAWATEGAIIEVVTAHELWHVIGRRASRPAEEFAAHCFTRELLGMPFSPLLYTQALRRLALEMQQGIRGSHRCATTWA